MTVNLGKKWSLSLHHLVELAMWEAQQSSQPHRHGAVLYASMNDIRNTSHNCSGHRLCGYDVPNLHAEANCLKPVYQWRKVHRRKVTHCWEKDCNLLVVRVTANQQLCDSKPCCMCINLMNMFGLRRVYYSNDKGELCYQKLGHNCDVEENYVSHGLEMMIQERPEYVKNCKLLLTRSQKNLLVRSQNLV